MIREIGDVFEYNNIQVKCINGACCACSFTGSSDFCYSFWKQNNRCKNSKGKSVGFLAEGYKKDKTLWISIDTPPSDNRDVLLKYFYPKELTGLGEHDYNYCKANYEDNDWVMSVTAYDCELVSWMEIPE